MYRAVGSRAVAASESALNITGGTTVVVRLREYRMAVDGAPSTEAMVAAELRRSTTAGTGTTYTPTVGQGAFPAAEATALSNLTAEPTYSGQLTHEEFNPRARAMWQAYDALGEILTPLTANNGLGFQCITVGGGSGNFNVDAAWLE